MTGFGRAEAEENGRKITIELKSVNHRFLDMNIRMPRLLLFLEDDLKNVVKARVSRGRLDIFVNYYSIAADHRVTADLPLIEAYMRTADALHKRLRVKNDVAVSHFLRIPEAFKVEEPEEDEAALKRLVQGAAAGALDALVTMRENEGALLKKDIVARLSTLSEIVLAIEEREPAASEEMRDKLKKRVEELLAGAEAEDGRFLAEVVYYAERQNITEELVRLRAHIQGLSRLMEKGDSMGRQLDFIVQEMNRELNTAGAKTADLAIAQLILDGKGEAEKIREQVQNIE